MLRPALVLLPLALVAACATRGGETGSAVAPADAAAAADGDCTLQTPLRPGVPGSPGHLIPSPRNPNGDSELAALMRRFVDDLQQARPRLEKGEPVAKLFATHRKMRCSWPTDLADRNERYDTMAVAYLSLVQAYDATPSKDTYNGVLAGCIACHSGACRGPIDRIDDLIWR